MRLCFHLGLLALLWLFVSTSGHCQAPYNSEERIDLTIDGVTTTVYPDEKKPQTDFWYVPNQLRVGRTTKGTASRLHFSMEILPHLDDPTKPGQIAVNLLIDPRLSSYAENRIKQKLVDIGRAAADPFDPMGSYAYINLRPIPFQVVSIAFDELFLQVDWLNRRDVERKTRLDAPFPVQLKLEHADATILVEALTGKRIHRIGRVTLEGKRTLPIVLSLALDENEMPLTHTFDESTLTLCNPTEHAIQVQSVRYFAENFWHSATVNQTIPPFTDTSMRIPSIKIKLKSFPATELKVDWKPQYNYPQALNLYFNNHLVSPASTLHLKNPEVADLPFKPSQLNLEVFDQLGLSQSYFIPLTGESKSVPIHAFGGIKRYRYQFLGADASGAAIASNWFERSGQFLGQDEWIDVSKDIKESVWAGAGQAEVVKLDSMFLVQTGGSLYCLPGRVALAKTADGVPKYELRFGEGRLQWFAALFLPVLPEQLQAIKKRYPAADLRFAEIIKATITLSHDGKELIRKQVVPSNEGSFQLRYSNDTRDAEQLYKGMLRARSTCVRVEISRQVGAVTLYSLHEINL